MTNSKATQAILLTALSGTLYGLMGFFGTKLLRENFSVSSMLFWRFLIAAIWMMLYGFVRKEPYLPFPKLPIIILSFILGAIFYSGTSALYFLAAEHTGTGIAMVIFFSYPVFIALFIWAKNNWKINPFEMISLIAIFIGLIFLKGNNNHSVTLVGILLAVASAFFYAVYVIQSKQMIKTLSSNYFTLLVCMSCAVTFLIISCMNHTFIFPSSFSAWGYVLALGIIATALPIQFLLEGLKYIGPLKASILSVLEPIVTLIIGVLFLQESLTVLQLLGVLILLSGAILIQGVRE